jgi:hypothetical protein
MTEVEAYAVVGTLLAGFPHAQWGDNTILLAVKQIQPTGATEAMEAALETIRTQRLLTIAGFFTCLAAVRERHLDEERWPPPRKALPSGEHFCTPEENREQLAKVRAQLAAMTGPLAKSLGNVVAGRPSWQRQRYDPEAYRHPDPEPGPRLDRPDQDYFAELARGRRPNRKQGTNRKRRR